MKGRTFKESSEDRVFLDNLYDAIVKEISGNYAQNYSYDIEYDGLEEDIYDSVNIKVEYNADFTDRDGRHPWIEISVHVDFEEMTIKGEGGITSKDDYRIDDNAESATEFSDFEVNVIASQIESIISEIGYELEM
jgi:hypothetical protein